jgi:thiol peroxidase
VLSKKTENVGAKPKAIAAKGFSSAFCPLPSLNCRKDTPMAQERQGEITFKGNPMTLIGPELNVGDTAPDFNAVAADLSPVNLSTDAGKKRLVIAVPSLDTAVCSLETKKFSDRIKELSGDTVAYVVSMDLPFAQKRYCGSEGVDNIKTVSDYREASFGESFGVLIKELKLLARSVFVIDPNNKITYKEIVNEVTHEPNYDAAIAAAKA